MDGEFVLEVVKLDTVFAVISKTRSYVNQFPYQSSSMLIDLDMVKPNDDPSTILYPPYDDSMHDLNAYQVADHGYINDQLYDPYHHMNYDYPNIPLPTNPGLTKELGNIPLSYPMNSYDQNQMIYNDYPQVMPCYQMNNDEVPQDYHLSNNLKLSNGDLFSRDFIMKEATRYSTLEDFRLNCPQFFEICRRNDWLADIYLIMNSPRGPNEMWDKGACNVEAKKYSNRSDFQSHNRAVYEVSLQNNWLDDICAHMQSSKSISNAQAQVPKVCGVDVNSSNKKNIISGRQALPENTSSKPSSNRETDPIKVVVDSVSSLTKEACRVEALKYTSRSEFQLKSPIAFNTATKNLWLNEVCAHMLLSLSRHPNGYWTKSRCRTEASKYITRSDFKRHCPGAYDSSVKNKWLNDICAHTVALRHPHGYWTKHMCENLAMKYQSAAEFRDAHSTAYKICKQNFWLHEFFRSNKQDDDDESKYLDSSQLDNDNDVDDEVNYDSTMNIVTEDCDELVIMSSRDDATVKEDVNKSNHSQCITSDCDAIDHIKTQGNVSSVTVVENRPDVQCNDLTDKSLQEVPVPVIDTETNVTNASNASNASNVWTNNDPTTDQVKSKYREIAKKYRNSITFRDRDPETYKVCFQNHWLMEFFAEELMNNATSRILNMIKHSVFNNLKIDRKSC